MHLKYQHLCIACLVIALVDALGSIASRQFSFNYAMIWPASILVYSALGYRLTQVGNLKTSVWLTSLLGIFDATFGWKISMLLNANTGNVSNHPTLQIWAITILFVGLYGAILGLISGGVAKLFNKRNSPKRSIHSNT